MPDNNVMRVIDFDPKNPSNQRIRDLQEVKAAPNLRPLVVGGRRMTLREAAMNTTDFPVLLQSGLRAILFDSFNEQPTTWQEFCATMSSDKDIETWLQSGRVGTLPQVPELAAYTKVEVALESPVTVRNYKYGVIFGVSEEMIRFDKTNIIAQYPADLGGAAKATIEATTYSVLSTAGNYTANSTTGDNDVGSNTGNTTFSAGGLLTAHRTLTTMKDRKSGRYLGVVPDTLICTPGVEWAARQLLLSPELVRASAYTTAEVYGTGQNNYVKGSINRIIVSPWLGTGFQWVLMQRNKAVVYQEVDPLQLLIADVKGHQDNFGYFNYDEISYRVRIWFGVGFKDQRYAYYSSSSTTPAVG
jgi:hypothetical protein